MSTVWPFLVKFASLIVCSLHCFDRGVEYQNTVTQHYA